jgi:hypothetical protein
MQPINPQPPTKYIYIYIQNHKTKQARIDSTHLIGRVAYASRSQGGTDTIDMGYWIV